MKRRIGRVVVAILLVLACGQILIRDGIAGADETGKLLSLAQTSGKFPELTDCERNLLRKAQVGDFAYCGPSEDDDDPANNPAKPAIWDPQRKIRAELIRWLCVDRAAKALVDWRGIRVHAARIAGELDLSFATVPFPLLFGNSLFTDDMSLTHAQLEFLQLAGTRTKAITGDRLKVRGGLHLRDGFSANGEVRLLGADIGGNLDCGHGTFGDALNADRIKVTGGVYLRDGFSAQGAVRLLGAAVDGDLSCVNGTFKNAGRNALSADGIKVTGNVLLRDFRAEGAVELVGAQIGGQLDCDGARFAPNSQLEAEQASVTGAFLWRNVKADPSSSLVLTHTRVGPLADDENSWPLDLDLDGFVYAGIANGPRNAESRLNWLLRQSRGFRWPGFWPQPYEQLAKVLREAGDDAGATTVMVAMEDSRRTDGDLSWWSWMWAWILKLTIGYGYDPFRAGWWVLGFVILGFFVFWCGKRAGVITEANADAAHYRPFNGLVYSLETFLPLVDLFHAKHWLPEDNGTCFAMFLRWYLRFHILAGWFFTTMFIAGVTGLVRKG